MTAIAPVRALATIGFVGCWAIVVACAGGKTSAMAPASAGGVEPAAMPGDPRAEIDALDQQITADLARAGLATSEPAACAASVSCTAEPMGLTPRVQDPTCKPAATDTCTQACTLSDSVCTSADRICELAGKLGGADAYANDKCQRGNESCKRTRDKCCGCT